MTLKQIDSQLCCVECDQIFDEKWQLTEGAQCPNVACPSHLDSALGDVLSIVRQLTEQGSPNVSFARALSGLLPIRADSTDAQDAAVLNTLKGLLNITAQTISAIEEARSSVVCSETNKHETATTRVNSTDVPVLRLLGHELEGAIIDVEHGAGFDDVCLGTMKRVRDALYGLSSASKPTRTN